MTDSNPLTRVDWLIEAGEHLDLARVAQGRNDRAVYRDSLTHAGVLALVALASAVTSLADTREDRSRAAEARAWTDGYSTGREDEAGSLPMDPRAVE